MRVLLVGASGALGTHLISRLIHAGHEVVGVTRRSGSLAGTGASEIIADVLNRKTFLASMQWTQADAVVSLLTSDALPPVSFRGMVRANRIRVEGTSTLIAAARRVGAAQLIATSPIYGYGLADHGDAVLDESAPFAQPDGTPNDDVQLAILTHEQQVRAYGGTVLRLGLPYGPDASEIPPVAARWDGLLPLIHRDDAAAAVELALAAAEGGTYNIVDDAPTSWSNLQVTQARVDGFRAPVALPRGVLRSIAPFAGQLIGETSLVVSNVAAERDLQWRPRFSSLEEGLAPVPSANIAV